MKELPDKVEYTYEEKEVKIGDLIIVADEYIYEATIHDADDFRNIVINQKQL